MRLTYRIYFLKDRDLSFMSHDNIMAKFNREPQRTDYKCVYQGEIEGNCGDEEDADAVYYLLNENHPADYRLRSLSMGDVVSFIGNGTTAQNYFCDSFGWHLLPGFFSDVKLEKTAGTYRGREYLKLKGVELFPEDILDAIDQGRTHLTVARAIYHVTCTVDGCLCRFSAKPVFRSLENIEAPHRWHFVTRERASVLAGGEVK